MADQTEVERYSKVAYAAGYEAGARDMRERAAKKVETEPIDFGGLSTVRSAMAGHVRSLPLTEDGK